MAAAEQSPSDFYFLPNLFRMIGPRFYYHGFVRNGMFFPIAGPFTTRDEADAIHDKAAAAAHRIDARTWFEQWGTAVLDAASRKGKLNAQLGL